MAQHASNNAGPSNFNAHVALESDIRMPSHLSDFLTKSVKEFKHIRTELVKCQKYLQRLSLQYGEGTIPNSLRMKPPKLQIGDPEAQTILDSGLAECTSAYRIKCLEALITAQESRLASLKTKLEEYKPDFENRLSSLINPLLTINFMSSLGKPLIESWQAQLSASFQSQIDSYLIQCQISEEIKAGAIIARALAREAAMGEAETLPIEPSIATLVRIEVQKEVKKALNSLVPKPKSGKKPEITKGKKPKPAMDGGSTKKKILKPKPKPKENEKGKKIGSENETRRNGKTSTRSNPSPTSSRRPTNRNPQTKSGSGFRKRSPTAKDDASKNPRGKPKKTPKSTTARGGFSGTR